MKFNPILLVKSLITILLLVAHRLLKMRSNIGDLNFGIRCLEKLKLLQIYLLLSDCLTTQRWVTLSGTMEAAGWFS